MTINDPGSTRRGPLRRILRFGAGALVVLFVISAVANAYAGWDYRSGLETCVADPPIEQPPAPQASATILEYITANFPGPIAQAYREEAALIASGEPSGFRDLERILEENGVIFEDYAEAFFEAHGALQADLTADAIERCYRHCGGIFHQVGDRAYGWFHSRVTPSCFSRTI